MGWNEESVSGGGMRMGSWSVVYISDLVPC